MLTYQTAKTVHDISCAKHIRTTWAILKRIPSKNKLQKTKTSELRANVLFVHPYLSWEGLEERRFGKQTICAKYLTCFMSSLSQILYDTKFQLDS